MNESGITVKNKSTVRVRLVNDSRHVDVPNGLLVRKGAGNHGEESGGRMKNGPIELETIAFISVF